MTREECKYLLDTLRNSGKYTAILFFKSQITNGVEERHIYADNNAEVCLWLEAVISSYKLANISYATYLNGELRDGKGDLFDE